MRVEAAPCTLPPGPQQSVTPAPRERSANAQANPNSRYFPIEAEWHGSWDASAVLTWQLDAGLRWEEARAARLQARAAEPAPTPAPPGDLATIMVDLGLRMAMRSPSCGALTSQPSRLRPRPWRIILCFAADLITPCDGEPGCSDVLVVTARCLQRREGRAPPGSSAAPCGRRA